MTETLFIDDEYLKLYSPLGKSIDVDEIYPFVLNAQSIYTQDVLGTPLYNSLLAKIDDDEEYSTIEWELVNLFSKALVYWTVYVALPHVMIKMRNAGVVKTSAEYTTNSDLSEMKYLREEMKNLAEFWDQRVINFLCNNGTSFPLYNSVSDDVYPSNSAYDSDIYLEDTYNGLTYDEIKFLKKYLS